MTLWKALFRSCLLRCPECGKGRFARSWIACHDECAHCGLDFRVDWGFYLGSIYVSYAVTGVIITATCVPLILARTVPWSILTPAAVGFCIAFPFWFWRYSRSIWFGLNYWLDKRGRAQRTMQQRAAEQTEKADGVEDQANDGQPRFQFTCPYCYSRDTNPESKRNSWSNCSKCGERVLLIPTQISEENPD